MLKTMKLRRSFKRDIAKDKMGENVPHLEITKVVLIHCHIANNVPNKLFGQLLDLSPKNFISLKTFNSKCSYIEVCFTDQNSKVLKIEVKLNCKL